MESKETEVKQPYEKTMPDATEQSEEAKKQTEEHETVDEQK